MQRLAKRLVPLVLLILPLAACSGSKAVEEDDGAAAKEAAAADPVAFMRSAIDELMAKPEHDAAAVDVQHILVAIGDAPGMRQKGITRTKEEAETEAAQLYARLIQGEDFKTLLDAHTDDKEGLPVYSIAGRNASFVEGFKKVGWRLEVGEIGVSPWHEKDSYYGWHIIQRLK